MKNRTLSNLGMAFTLAAAVTLPLAGAALKISNWHSDQLEDRNWNDLLAAGCAAQKVDQTNPNMINTPEFRLVLDVSKDSSRLPVDMVNQCFTPRKNEVAATAAMERDAAKVFAGLGTVSLVGAGLLAGMAINRRKAPTAG